MISQAAEVPSNVSAVQWRKHRARPKILFFDYWTKGAFHFTDLIKAAEPDDAEFQLLHLGSFRDSRTPPQQNIDGLVCVDISGFPGLGLEQILGKLDPDVVVGLNMTGIGDRALFLTCDKLGIPTVFFQHGAWLDRDSMRAELANNDQEYKLGDRLSRVPKYLRVLPWYLRASGMSQIATTARVIAHTFRRPASSHFFPTAPEQLWPDRAIALNQDSADLLMQNFHLPAMRIRVVGNPELDGAVERRNAPLNEARRAELIRAAALIPGKPIVCYLEDGFVEQKAMGWTQTLRGDHARDLYNACVATGTQLLVRPHPATDDSSMRLALNDRPNVSITRAIGLIDSIDIADVVVGTMSTALESAVVLGKPILVPLWYLNNDPAKSGYLRCKIAQPVAEKTDLPQAITTHLNFVGRHEISDEAMRRIGPIDGAARKRIYSEILFLARRHAGKRAVESVHG